MHKGPIKKSQIGHKSAAAIAHQLPFSSSLMIPNWKLSHGQLFFMIFIRKRKDRFKAFRQEDGEIEINKRLKR